MNLKKQIGDSENGITIISLVITIIVLIILSTITLKWVTGQSGIISSTSKAADAYKLAQSKEQVEMLLQSIIIKKSLEGKSLTVTTLAEELAKEKTLIKNVQVNKGTQNTSDDIIVTTTNLDNFQILYDEKNGQTFIEYIGIEDGLETPEVLVAYDKMASSLSVTSNCEDGISNIELMHNEDTVDSVQNIGETTFNIDDTGWYTIKATSNTGKVKNAWVRMSDTIAMPKIEIVAHGAEENNWYGKDKVPVNVKISTEDEATTGIYYKTKVDEEYKYVEGKKVDIQVKEEGRTVIYAYAVNVNKKESDIVNLTVKYDSVKPEINKISQKGTKGENDWYKTDVEISLDNIIEDGSGVVGYYWWEAKIGEEVVEVPQEEKRYVKKLSTPIKVISEGKKRLCFQIKDRAGNMSKIQTVDIGIDKANPSMSSIQVDTYNERTIDVRASGVDSSSGIASYTFQKSLISSTEGFDEGEKILSTDVICNYQYKGLLPNTNYWIRVIATDEAGNEKESIAILQTTKEKSAE